MNIAFISRLTLGSVLVLSLFGFAARSGFAADGDSVREPDLPIACGSIQVADGNKVHFRVFAIGVQIYRWNGSAWEFVAPEANLYSDAGYRGKVGTHYAGPAWETNSGSSVRAARVPDTGCTPDPTAIPWLLLRSVSNEGPGPFSKTTYIQRVNTVGGVSPSLPGIFVNEERRVPYTTEYYFYRSEDRRDLLL